MLSARVYKHEKGMLLSHEKNLQETFLTMKAYRCDGAHIQQPQVLINYMAENFLPTSTRTASASTKSLPPLTPKKLFLIFRLCLCSCSTEIVRLFMFHVDGTWEQTDRLELAGEQDVFSLKSALSKHPNRKIADHSK